MAALFLGCGELRNEGLGSFLTPEDVASGSCTTDWPLVEDAPVLPVAHVGIPWVGWVHALGGGGAGVGFEATTLPPGVRLDPQTGRLSGIVTAAGEWPIAVTATALACPESVVSLVSRLVVSAPCEGSACPPGDGCGAARADPMSFYLASRPGGQAMVASTWLSADGLTVVSVGGFVHFADGRPPMQVLRLDAPSEKADYVFYYRAPGGLALPIEGAAVDLRFFRGPIPANADQPPERYLFLTSGNALVLAFYDGDRPPAELARSCPDDSTGSKCALPAFQLADPGCEVEPPRPDCSARRLALDVSTDVEGTPLTEQRRLIPGDAVTVDGNVFRLADVWAGRDGPSCSAGGAPFRVQFLSVQKQYCALTELVGPASMSPVTVGSESVDAGPGALLAPAAIAMESRLVYPADASLGTCHWATVGPDEAEHPAIKPGEAGAVTLSLGLAGRYTVFSACEAWPAWTPGLMPACPATAAQVFELGSARAFRVELLYSGSVVPALWVGERRGSVAGDGIVALDLDPPDQPATVVVIASSGLEMRGGVSVVLRVVRRDALGRAELLFRGVTTLVAGAEWHPGTLPPSGAFEGIGPPR